MYGWNGWMDGWNGWMGGWLGQVNKIWVKLASRNGIGPVSLVVAKAGAGVEVTGFGGTGAAKAESKHFYVRDKTPGILEVW